MTRVMSWCYPDDDRRAVLLPIRFRVILDMTIPGGGVDTVIDEVGGAVWIPPDVTVEQDRMGEDLVAASAEYAERVVTLMELLGEHHPEDEPHQYLFVLGTRTDGSHGVWVPPFFGPCWGSATTSACPPASEATSVRNRQLYERHGFEVTEVSPCRTAPRCGACGGHLKVNDERGHGHAGGVCRTPDRGHHPSVGVVSGDPAARLRVPRRRGCSYAAYGSEICHGIAALNQPVFQHDLDHAQIDDGFWRFYVLRA